MAIKDKIKWDKKYKETPLLLEDRDVSEKLKNILKKIQGKKVLDIASGAGRNSIFLAKAGFEVEALDISQIALNKLDEKSYANIKTKCIDLENYTPSQNSYDFIVMTNYLDRDMIPNLSNALKKGGILFIETYMEHKDNEKPKSNPNFLLKKDELKTFFGDSFKILDYDEFDNESYEMYKMKKQSIIIQK